MLKLKLAVFLTAVAAIGIGCGKADIKIIHDPIVAKNNETVTFTAEVLSNGPADVQILVNAVAVKNCANVPTGGTCVYTGGPYPAYEGTTVAYAVNSTNDEGTLARGYYYFGVTDTSYNWGSRDYAPARLVGPKADYDDLIFHKASDYASLGAFVDDVQDKLDDVFDEQDIIENPWNMDKMNFWVYNKTASDMYNCGHPHADASSDMPWADAHAILHVANFGDCTNLGDRRYSAEGSNTKAFLHESGHGLFGLADEYCGNTHYFQPANEPNIWDTEAGCRAEQTSKGRDPNECYQFCANQGGWWGIHSGTTVMTWGMVGDAWGTEADEHMDWYFNQFSLPY